MAKYFDVYTQIPGINPCPQVWVVEDDPTDGLVSFRDGLMYVENIVGTTVKELSNTKRLPAGKNILCALSNHNMTVKGIVDNFFDIEVGN